jgi:transcriptional regulator with XRE-family HTH domain
MPNQTPKPNVRQAGIVRSFATRLKALRAARSMTQRDLAEKAGTTVSYISRLEAGSAAPGIDLLERLATALGANATELLPGPDAADVTQEELRALFEGLLKKAGAETRSLLAMLLTRLGESPTTRR